MNNYLNKDMMSILKVVNRFNRVKQLFVYKQSDSKYINRGINNK